MSYGVGDTVLCIKGGWGSFPNGHPLQVRFCPNIPLRGRLYLVRDLGQLLFNSTIFIRLVELVNPLNPCWNVPDGVEPVFYPDQFVPIKRVATDISVFRGLLDKKPGPVELTDWVQNELDDAMRRLLEDS